MSDHMARREADRRRGVAATIAVTFGMPDTDAARLVADAGFGCLSMQSGNTVVGAVLIMPADGVANGIDLAAIGATEADGVLIALAVRPEWRRRGIARKLVARSVRWLRQASTNGRALYAVSETADGQELFSSLEWPEVRRAEVARDGRERPAVAYRMPCTVIDWPDDWPPDGPTDDGR